MSNLRGAGGSDPGEKGVCGSLGQGWSPEGTEGAGLQERFSALGSQGGTPRRRGPGGSPAVGTYVSGGAGA